MTGLRAMSLFQMVKIVDSLRFLSPDGRFCTSRVEAIKYLMKDGAAHPEDMQRMTNGLLSVSFKYCI